MRARVCAHNVAQELAPTTFDHNTARVCAHNWAQKLAPTWTTMQQVVTSPVHTPDHVLNMHIILYRATLPNNHWVSRLRLCPYSPSLQYKRFLAIPAPWAVPAA